MGEYSILDQGGETDSENQCWPGCCRHFHRLLHHLDTPASHIKLEYVEEQEVWSFSTFCNRVAVSHALYRTCRIRRYMRHLLIS